MTRIMRQKKEVKIENMNEDKFIHMYRDLNIHKRISYQDNACKNKTQKLIKLENIKLP